MDWRCTCQFGKWGVVGRSASELWEVCKWVVGEFEMEVVEIVLGMLVPVSHWMS